MRGRAYLSPRTQMVHLANGPVKAITMYDTYSYCGRLLAFSEVDRSTLDPEIREELAELDAQRPTDPPDVIPVNPRTFKKDHPKAKICARCERASKHQPIPRTPRRDFTVIAQALSRVEQSVRVAQNTLAQQDFKDAPLEAALMVTHDLMQQHARRYSR